MTFTANANGQNGKVAIAYFLSLIKAVRKMMSALLVLSNRPVIRRKRIGENAIPSGQNRNQNNFD